MLGRLGAKFCSISQTDGGNWAFHGHHTKAHERGCSRGAQTAEQGNAWVAGGWGQRAEGRAAWLGVGKVPGEVVRFKASEACSRCGLWIGLC